MKCTSCKKSVADDTAVCPYCDAVLDPSLLDASPPEEDDEEPTPPPRRPALKAKGKPGVRPGVKKVGIKTAAPTVKDNDWRSQISEEDWKENQGKAAERFVADKAMDPDLALGETKRYLLLLPLADKLALGGTVALLTCTFFPWRETVSEGEVLGILSSGFLVTVLSSIALAGILIRTRGSMPTLNPLLPWVAQLGCVGVSALWCLAYTAMAWDQTKAMSPIGNYEVWVSKPAFGLVLAIIAAIIAIVGTIFGLKDLGR